MAPVPWYPGGMQRSPSTRRRGLGRWVGSTFLVVAALGIGLAAYLYWGSARSPAPAFRASAPDSASREQARPLAQVGTSPPADLGGAAGVGTALPAVDESDSFVRELVSQLSSNPELARWLVTEDLVRRFAAAVANVALGESPSAHLEFLAPDEQFAVRETEAGLFVASRSYARYDLFGDAFAALDVEGTASLYATLKPLIEQAYRDLGYDDAFDDALDVAFERLLEVPAVAARVFLNQRVITYEFRDPELEGLDAAQRHFLRMGPRNVRMVQAKLRELAPALGITLLGAPPD